MAQLHSIATARARQAAQNNLKAAEAALAEAAAQLDDASGIGVNLTLQSRVRAAERRVTAARAALNRVDPGAAQSQ